MELVSDSRCVVGGGCAPARVPMCVCKCVRLRSSIPACVPTRACVRASCVCVYVCACIILIIKPNEKS